MLFKQKTPRRRGIEMKNSFFLKKSAWLIMAMLVIIVAFFTTIGFGVDNKSAATVAAIAAVAFAAFTAATTANNYEEKEPFSFGKSFFSFITFLILAGIGMHFIFSGSYLSGFVLVGAGIAFLVILNTLDIVVQNSGKPSIFAKKAKKPAIKTAAE